MTERDDLTETVLEQHDRIFQCLLLPQTQDWLALDLTMQQLKTLVLLEMLGSATAGQLARGLGVGLSNMTRIVDRLCGQGLATRGEDPADRRATRVEATPEAHELAACIRRLRHELLTRVLDRLTVLQLRGTAQAVRALADAAEQVARETVADLEVLVSARPPQKPRADSISRPQ